MHICCYFVREFACILGREQFGVCGFVLHFVDEWNLPQSCRFISPTCPDGFVSGEYLGGFDVVDVYFLLVKNTDIPCIG